MCFIMQVLHSKLTMKSGPDASCRSIKSAVLYDGSITDFDYRLRGFDIGTCLEVYITNPFTEPMRRESWLINTWLSDKLLLCVLCF